MQGVSGIGSGTGRSGEADHGGPAGTAARPAVSSWRERTRAAIRRPLVDRDTAVQGSPGWYRRLFSSRAAVRHTAKHSIIPQAGFAQRWDSGFPGYGYSPRIRYFRSLGQRKSRPEKDHASFR